jgi:hypothetical protein
MSDSVHADDIRTAILEGLKEAFEDVNGYFLDKGTSLFETLETVDATEASRSAAPEVGTIAAQVNHVAFYIDEAIRFVQEGPHSADWEGSWKVGTVTDEEWAALKANLRTQYGRAQELVRANPTWDAMNLGGAISLVAHCAYHLGEIRQGLAAIRARA